MYLKCLTTTTHDPDLTELKCYLHIDHSDDDQLLKRLWKAAETLIEQYAQCSLWVRNYGLTVPLTPEFRNRFGCPRTGEIKLPIPMVPIHSLVDRPKVVSHKTYGIKKFDLMKNGRTAYVVFPHDLPGEKGQLEIMFKAGYAQSFDDIPPLLKEAMCLLIYRLYDSRWREGKKKRSFFDEHITTLLNPFRQTRTALI